MIYSVSIKQSALKSLKNIAHEDRLRIIEAIDDLDDVQNVYSNIDITEDLAKELEA